MSLNFANVCNRPYIAFGNNYKKNNLHSLGFRGQELVTPEVTEKLLQIGEEIDKAEKIAIFTHRSPDGDAASSTAAMENLISSKYPNKTVDVFIVDDIPQGFKRALEDSKKFKYIRCRSDVELFQSRNYDLAIAVDTPERGMLDKGFQVFKSAKRKVKIDHHSGGKDFADINLVCGEASSASQVVLLLADSMKVPINKDLASDIYMGMVTDTQGFRYMKKPADVLDDASRLAKTGFDTRKVYCSSMDYMSKAALQVYIDTLSRIKLTEDGKISSVIIDESLNRQDLGKTDFKNIIDRIIGEVMPNIEDVKIAAKLNLNGTQVSGSLRGNGVRVDKIAEGYGGGGHEFAAGFINTGKTIKTPEQVLQELSEYIKEQEK